MSEVSASRVEAIAMGDTDQALVRALQEHSPQAYSELSRRFAAPLHWFIAAHLHGDTDTAEELLVETFVDAARNIARFDPARATLSAWLYGIANRHVQMEITRRKRLKIVPRAAQVPIEIITDTATAGDPAADSIARLDAQRQVAQLAQVLSNLEMTTLILSCVEELSAAEIGQIIARSERAVHSILHRARQKARSKLGGKDD
jgi:RNA polymerase sigma factor (sigma-70 family)